ncbi:hypothetical protein [Streptomyces viridosporus]|uniref:MmyB family transcriptional regulator n=1 Tax=Streptomyces viridosporus TaxID=67581 RepID=UPI003D9F4EB5
MINRLLAGGPRARSSRRGVRDQRGRNPYNRELSDLIGELSTHSEDFRTLWAAHDVRLHHTGLKRFHHPAVGDLTLAFESLPVPTDPRPDPHRTERRARHPIGRRPQTAHHLGRHTRPDRSVGQRTHQRPTRDAPARTRRLKRRA